MEAMVPKSDQATKITSVKALAELPGLTSIPSVYNSIASHDDDQITVYPDIHDFSINIPLIDFSLLTSNNPDERFRIIQQLKEACQDWGVFMADPNSITIYLASLPDASTIPPSIPSLNADSASRVTSLPLLSSVNHSSPPKTFSSLQPFHFPPSIQPICSHERSTSTSALPHPWPHSPHYSAIGEYCGCKVSEQALPPIGQENGTNMQASDRKSEHARPRRGGELNEMDGDQGIHHAVGGDDGPASGYGSGGGAHCDGDHARGPKTVPPRRKQKENLHSGKQVSGSHSGWPRNSRSLLLRQVPSAARKRHSGAPNRNSGRVRQSAAFRREVELACKELRPRELQHFCAHEDNFSYNARGAASPQFRRTVRELRDKHLPDIFIVTETRMAGQRAQDIRDSFGFDGMAWVDPKGFSDGICLLWDTAELEAEFVSKSNQEITLVFKVTNERLLQLQIVPHLQGSESSC
ncbi:hypothetical protein CCACVL1_10369 [Corchorus capsularis]|uniref:Non-haem dioxygenase N-terminal domain-containing protein n=1 Tax=Corchorus capsularis TaxID=210143 RepID=A0A1R3IRK4_COCAP|nr:hypothetical protein CCACVL1_10369 [Corchorus capsularis]